MAAKETQAKSKSRSKSALSKSTSIASIPYFGRAMSGGDVRGMDANYYSLVDMINYVGLDYPELLEQLEGYTHVNDHLAKFFVARLLSKMKSPQTWTVLANVEIPALKHLPQLCCISSRQRIDVIVCNKEITKVALTMEVQSSPMIETERKATLGAADLLRLYRCKDTSITTVTTFAFPNKDGKHCIIEIIVSWEEFQFVPQYKQYPDMEEGIARVISVLETSCTNTELLPLTSEISSQFMHLSHNECTKLCGGEAAEQVHSFTHLMVLSSTKTVYKVLYDTKERINITFAALKFEAQAPKFTVDLKVHEQKRKYIIYKYAYRPHNTLTGEQAKQCVRSLTEGIVVALNELHMYGLAHNDVRLDNICFDEDFMPVLLDLDRSSASDEVPEYFSGSLAANSCMYRHVETITSGAKSDFFQLGWLLASILSPSESYHERKWEHQGRSVRDNSLIKHLILYGVYESRFLTTLPHDVKSLQEVITSTF